MKELFTVLWFIALCVSTLGVFAFVGMAGLLQMFPEGKRWWTLPSQLLSLLVFAVVVLNHPF